MGTPAPVQDTPVTLERLFTPRGVVVIGASTNGTKLGAVMARSVRRFGGPVALVNSRHPQRNAGVYGSVAEAAEQFDAPLDLAILCVPAAACAEALARAGEAGVRAAVVCAAEFAEAPGPGASRQHAMERVAADFGIRILGPNTSGFVAPHQRLVASFVASAANLPAGNVAIVASSGGVNHALAFMLANAGIGVSLAVGIGNGVNVTAADVISYVAADPATDAVALHVETVPDGRALTDAVVELTRTKPLVALVVGRSDVSDFASSHTGNLATSWRVVRSALAEAGAVVVDTEREAVDALIALSCVRLPPAEHTGVGIVTAQAGPGLIVTDQLHSDGVAIPELDVTTCRRLAELLPAVTYQRNPVDTGRPDGMFDSVLATVGADPGVDVLGVYALVEPDAVDLTRSIPAIPTLVGVGGLDADVGKLRAKLQLAGVPLLTSPSSLATAIRALVQDARGRARQHDGEPARPSRVISLPDGVREGPWDEHSAKHLLEQCGIPTPNRQVCDTHADAERALGELGVPVVVKILSPTMLHKSDVAGVHLGVASRDQLHAALNSLDRAGACRYLVEQMAPDGIELLVGARRDPVFGPIVVLGLGGTMSEVFGDVTTRLAPLTRTQAFAMPDELDHSVILHGWRGHPPIDRERLADIIVALGGLMSSIPELAEVEINPLRAVPGGFLALDAVVTLARGAPS